jgi:hypothetical protein
MHMQALKAKGSLPADVDELCHEPQTSWGKWNR